MINKKKLRKIKTPHGTFYWRGKGRYAEDLLIYADEAKTFAGPDSVDNGRGVHVRRGFSTLDCGVVPKYVADWLDNYFNA